MVTLAQGVTVVWITEAQLDSRKRGLGEGLNAGGRGIDLEVGRCRAGHPGPGWKLVDPFSGAPDWQPGIPASLMAAVPTGSASAWWTCPESSGSSGTGQPGLWMVLLSRYSSGLCVPIYSIHMRRSPTVRCISKSLWLGMVKGNLAFVHFLIF